MELAMNLSLLTTSPAAKNLSNETGALGTELYAAVNPASWKSLSFIFIIPVDQREGEFTLSDSKA